jgi:hypothetical protein
MRPRDYGTKALRGVIVEDIEVSTPLDPFMTLRAAAQYTSLSKRRLEYAIGGLPGDALPHYRLGKRIVVRRSDLDGWMTRHRHECRPSLKAVVAAAKAASTR